MGFDARVNKAPDVKSPWDIAVQTLATHHFKSGPDVHERKTLAERFLNDSLHYMVSHLGKDEKTSKAALARDFSDPLNISAAMRKYQMGGL